MTKRRKIFRKRKTAKLKSRKFTVADIQNIRILSEGLGRLIPYSGLGKFNLKNFAKESRLHKYLPQKQQNKKESITYFLRNVHREHPRALKKFIREILPLSVEKRHREGDPILSAEANELATILLRVGIDLRKEIKELNLPISRPTIVPPPHNIQEILKKFILHPYLMPECQKLFLDGHVNESVRKALEKYEVYVSNKSGLSLKGKDLMAKAFSINNPVIKLNTLVTESDKNEQEGFMFISMGVMQWWRNTLSHGDEKQVSHHEAIGRLFLVSNIISRLDVAV